MSDKTLKQRIRDKEQIVVINMHATDTPDEMARVIENNPCDILWIDGQHSPLNEERIVEFCNAADALNMPVQFRIPHTQNAYLIGHYLDLGVSGIEVPQVELDSTVDEALSQFYFPQYGNRSWIGGNAKSFPKERLEYADWWNNYGILMIQLESIEAVTNARNLAKSGVDCFTFGPADLTFSIEGHPDHPLSTVDECVKNVVKQVEGTDTAISFRNNVSSEREKYAEMGVTIFIESPK